MQNWSRFRVGVTYSYTNKEILISCVSSSSVSVFGTFRSSNFYLFFSLIGYNHKILMHCHSIEEYNHNFTKQWWSSADDISHLLKNTLRSKSIDFQRLCFRLLLSKPLNKFYLLVCFHHFNIKIKCGPKILL